MCVCVCVWVGACGWVRVGGCGVWVRACVRVCVCVFPLNFAAVDCGYPEVGPYVQVDGSNFTYGSQVYFSCPTGASADK